MCLLRLSDDPLKRCFTSNDSDPYFTSVSGPLIVLQNLGPLWFCCRWKHALVFVSSVNCCLLQPLVRNGKCMSEITSCQNKKKKKILCSKNTEFSLRGWTQTKILFRKMEKIFRLKSMTVTQILPRTLAQPESNLWSSICLESGGSPCRVLWLWVQQWGQTEEWKQDLCHRNHLYAFKYKHIGSSVVVRLLHLKALKRLCSDWKLHLWTWMSSCRRSHRVCFCLQYSEQNVGHFQTSSVPQKEKLEGLSPLSLLHGVALLTVVQIFSMTYSCTSAMLNKAWYRSTSSF